MSIDTRVFEVHHHYADDPELDGSQYWTLAQMKERYPSLAPLVEPAAFERLSYTVDLHQIVVTVACE